jgi:hypothetical protein
MERACGWFSGNVLVRSWHEVAAARKLPGTEIAFEENVKYEPSFGIGILPNKKIPQRLARFRQINMDNAVTHHDALEFPGGEIVLLTRLHEGQQATVLQLPASPHGVNEMDQPKRAAVVG